MDQLFGLQHRGSEYERRARALSIYAIDNNFCRYDDDVDVI